MEAWILLLLKQWTTHGYGLLQSLKQLGLASVDHTTLYKLLRRLEERGIVSSAWHTPGTGPARRTYTLTEAGEQLLQAWAKTVGNYQKTMAAFFNIYSAMLQGPTSNHSSPERNAGAAQGAHGNNRGPESKSQSKRRNPNG